MACTIAGDGKLIACAVGDGSLQFYDSVRIGYSSLGCSHSQDGPYTKTTMKFDEAHQNGSETSDLKFSPDGLKLLSRGGGKRTN